MTVTAGIVLNLLRSAGACSPARQFVANLLATRTPGQAWRVATPSQRSWFVRALGLHAGAAKWPWSRVEPFVRATLTSRFSAVDQKGERVAWTYRHMILAAPRAGGWFQAHLLPALRSVYE